MSEVINFYQDFSFYLDLFDKKCDDGDCVGAFSALKYAEKVAADGDDLEDVAIARAQGYAEIGRFERSNEIFYTLLGNDRAKTDCYFGLAQNLYCMNNNAAAGYYVRLLVEEEPDIEIGDLADYFDFDGMDAEKNKYRVVYPAGEYETDLADEMISSGRIDDAVSVLSGVTAKSKEHKQALNDLTMCYMLLNNLPTAEQTAQESLELYPDNAVALCNLIYVYRAKKDKEKTDEAVKRVLLLDKTTPFENTKIATTMCELDRHQDAVKYLTLVLKEKPFIEVFMVLLGIAHYNSQNYDESIAVFDKLLKIDSRDSVAKYYLRKVKTDKEAVENGAKPQKLTYIPQLPYSEILLRFKEIEKALKQTKLTKLNDENSYERECFDWLFDTGETVMETEYVNALAASSAVQKEELLKSILYINGVAKSVKVAVFERLMELNNREISAVDDYRFFKIKIRYPQNFKNYPSVIKKAYFLSFSALAFIAEPKLDNLKAVTEKAYDVFKSKNLLMRNYKALSVLLMIRAGCPDRLLTPLCRIMNISENTVKKYDKSLFE